MSNYDQMMAEATEGLKMVDRKAKEHTVVERFPKGSTSKQSSEELARTLVEQHGWIINTEAIQKAGLGRNGDPVITCLVHAPGNGKDGRATGAASATFQRWNSGAALVTNPGVFPVEIDLS